MTEEALRAAPAPNRRPFRLATILALLGATSLAACGLFEPEEVAPARFDWKFGLKAVLRYAFVGLALWGGLRMLPADARWVVVGLSTMVAAVVIDGFLEHLAGRRSGTGSAQ